MLVTTDAQAIVKDLSKDIVMGAHQNRISVHMSCLSCDRCMPTEQLVVDGAGVIMLDSPVLRKRWEKVGVLHMCKHFAHGSLWRLCMLKVSCLELLLVVRPSSF